MVHTWFVKFNSSWLPLLYFSVLEDLWLFTSFRNSSEKWMFFLFHENRPFSLRCRRLQAKIKALLQQIRTRHQSYPPIVLPTHRKPACCVIVGWQEDKWRRGTELRKKVGLERWERKISLVQTCFCYTEKFRSAFCNWTRSVWTVRFILEQEGAKDDGKNSSRHNGGESARNWLMSGLLHWLL